MPYYVKEKSLFKHNTYITTDFSLLCDGLQKISFNHACHTLYGNVWIYRKWNTFHIKGMTYMIDGNVLQTRSEEFCRA